MTNRKYIPTLDEFVDVAASGRRIPLRTRIPADLETPVSAFLKLRAAYNGGAGEAFLLESVEQGIQLGRYSFIGVSPNLSIRLNNDVVEITRDGERESHALDGRDPLSFVRDEIERSPEIESYGIPGPFAGAVGYLSYDIGRYFERLPQPRNDGLGLPDYCFVVPRTLVVFDHVKCEIEIVALPHPEGDDPEHGYAAAQQEIEALLSALATPLDANGYGPYSAGEAPESNMTREEYEGLVRGAKDRALRILNPSPYLFFCDFEDFQMIGSSPEMLVKLDGRTATLSPIAGTRPRGETPTVDARLEEELLADEKERAEHVMLVDLGRNDLGRVCETGSVDMESLMHIERYSHVMHIVSRVSGRLREDVDGLDLVRATFPAGTVSGAPKIRAMELIADFERDKRGPYAGAVGYFGRHGDVDMCITIRTIIMVGNRYYVQAGAGIVADSDPALEYEETLGKIRALVRAVEIAEKGL